jgi:hypothetical protein
MSAGNRVAAVVAVLLACGCGPKGLPVTVDRQACDLSQCPRLRVHLTGDEPWDSTEDVSASYQKPVIKILYRPTIQDEGARFDFALTCIGEDGCPTCFGEGGTVLFDPLTIVMSPDGQ